MEATIQSNQMDVDKEEARPNLEVLSLPQERHIWRMPELPPIPQGEDHKTLRRLEPLSYKDKVKKIKNLLKKQSLLSIDQKKELEMTPALETDAPVASTSSRSVQGQAQRTSEEEERSQEPSRQGKRQSQLEQTLPTRVQDCQIGAFSHGQCIQHGQNSDGIHSQGAGKDGQDISMQIIQKIHVLKSSIDVELGKFDAKINKITSDISELKRNDKKNTEWYH
ncbi:hypothetical protein O181_125151 [Austropuccinia psidii MF-1]|uniref:Uncharacterized protein n=1 Tax=Austropuccinia psidii MF-1 TaxID=1389203 RepID=A0A9Q3KRT4_9BASI|nr:hypothetical protein [Austropuccinia psidii MF-1]